MSNRVVAADACTTFGVNCNIKHVTHFHMAFFHMGVMAGYLCLNLLRINHTNNSRVIFHNTGVTDLTTAFTIKRRGIQNHNAVIACRHFFNLLTIKVKGNDLSSLAFGFRITGKGRIRTIVFKACGHLKFSAGASLVALLLHGGVKTIHVHRHITFTADVCR